MKFIIYICFSLLLSNITSANIIPFTQCVKAGFGANGYCYGDLYINARLSIDEETHGFFEMDATNIIKANLKDKNGFDVLLNDGLFYKDHTLLKSVEFTGEYWSFKLTSLSLRDINLNGQHQQSISFSGTMQHIKKPPSHTKDENRGGIMDTGTLKITTKPEKFFDKGKAKIRSHKPHEDRYEYDLTGGVVQTSASIDPEDGHVNYEFDNTAFGTFSADVEGRHTISEPTTRPMLAIGIVILLLFNIYRQK